MKLSFSKKSSKSSSRPTSNPAVFGGADKIDERPEQITYLTQFDPSESKSRTAVSVSQAIGVIPPKPNEWRPLKKMKNLELPIDSDLVALGLDKFETQTKTLGEESNGASVTYGLTVRKSNMEKVTVLDDAIEHDESRSFIVSDTQKFKEDLEALGDDPGFEDMPVEGFGVALLAGYGWTEGKGIGKNAKEDVKVRQYEKGAQKQGLGFKPEQQTSRKEVKGIESHGRGIESHGRGIESHGRGIESHGRGSESHGRGSESHGRGSESHGRGSESRDRGSNSCDRSDLSDRGRAKNLVRIVRGSSKDDLVGLKGEVVSEDNGWLILKLANGKEEVRVRAKDVAELGSKEEYNCLKMLKELRVGKETNESGKRRRDEGNRKRDDNNGETGSGKMGWLVSNIRVRVISKKLKGGRLYKKKGEVVDVVGPMSCDVLMDESRELIQGLNQEFLETALPKRGGPVRVLAGPHKGVYGNLVDRDLDREIGVVRNADTHEHFNVQLDQVAEYIGDPSLAGY